MTSKLEEESSSWSELSDCDNHNTPSKNLAIFDLQTKIQQITKQLTAKRRQLEIELEKLLAPQYAYLESLKIKLAEITKADKEPEVCLFDTFEIKSPILCRHKTTNIVINLCSEPILERVDSESLHLDSSNQDTISVTDI